jgi:hypothetical protein
MSGRIYTVVFSGVSVSATQDLLTAFCGANMALRLHSVTLDQDTATAVDNVLISIKRLPAIVTPGSGGTAPTPIPSRTTDAAATFTAHANDTTRSTTSAGGGALTLTATGWNIVNGYLHLPPEEDRFSFAPGEACVISLDAAPSSAITASGTAWFEEVF